MSETETSGYSKLAVRIASALALLLCAAFAWWVTLLVLVVSALASVELHPRPFDAKLWNDPEWRSSLSIESHYHSIRQRMVDDLLAHHLHAGLTKDEVLALIGPKDENPRYKGPDSGAWIYGLGAQRGMPVDDEWLFVTFDTSERMSSAVLRTD